jgi:prevent-host-death family protein
MEIYTTSQAKDHLFEIMEHTQESCNPIYIVGKNNQAVLISAKDYKAMIETLHIMSIPGLKKSILNSSNAPLEEFVSEIDWDNV